MRTSEDAIYEVLGGEKQYVIPVFQRGYEWEQDGWRTLWEDLLGLTEDEPSSVATHFIGPMVVLAVAMPRDVIRYYVIDGQQRLMTLSILLAALRDRATDIHLENLASRIRQSSYFDFQDIRGEKIRKVFPRIRDRDTFYAILDRHPKDVDSNSLLAQGYRYFYTELEQATPEQQNLFVTENPTAFLENLYLAITQRVKVIMIALGEGDNPSNIYESLNFKNSKLKDSALIRNSVFVQMGPPDLEKQEAFQSAYWRTVEDPFEKFGNKREDELTDFYFRYLTSKKGYFTRRRLYSEFTKYITQTFPAAKKNLPQLANELARYGRYYISVKKKCEDDPELELAFQRFRMLDTDTALPLVLWLFDRYDNPDSPDRLSKGTFLQMLRDTESFILRRAIMRYRTRGYGELFAEARKPAETLKGLWEYYADRGWPSDEEIREALKTFPFYSARSVECKLILAEIEKSYGHKEKIDLSDSGVTIEHVLAQNLTQSWREMLGDNAESSHEQYVHTLGNLTLTGYNAELGDQPYEEKKVGYANSNLRLNTYFAPIPKWGVAEILARTSLLADKFVDLWGKPKWLRGGTVAAKATKGIARRAAQAQSKLDEPGTDGS